MKSFKEIQCPKCGAPKLKFWKNLSDDQKFLVERFPGSTEFSREERQKHRFCVRCWFEDSGIIENAV